MAEIVVQFSNFTEKILFLTFVIYYKEFSTNPCFKSVTDDPPPLSTPSPPPPPHPPLLPQAMLPIVLAT